MERWVSFSMLRMLEGAGIEQARQRAASHSVTAWRDLTAASIDFERRWRRAIRHRYRSLVRLVVGAWRGLLAKQHARWGVVLEAETRFGRRRRTRALWQWYNLAVPAATAATLAEAHAVLGRKRRSLPRWRDGAAHVLERSQARHLAVCHWAGVVCRRLVNGWSGYVALRQAKRTVKAARLQAAKLVLLAAARRRVLRAWATWHRGRMEQRATLANKAALFRGRRQMLALTQMQHHTVDRRIALHERRAAEMHLATSRAVRELTCWRQVARMWWCDRA